MVAVLTPLSPATQTMTHNEVLRSIRYMLDLSDIKLIGIMRLSDAGIALEKDDVLAILKREEEDGFVECSDHVLAHFLDGLIFHLRGKQAGAPPRPVAKRVSNNLVLKKLRVAFELKDVDMHQIFAASGFAIGKPELSALFRLPGHKHFRQCGDQLLRNFLKGLTLRVRPG
jgi:uncharacterized protein YehS (DUF1456 family)